MLCTVILGHEFLAGLLQESDVIISLVVILHQADWLLNHQYFHSCQWSSNVGYCFRQVHACISVHAKI